MDLPAVVLAPVRIPRRLWSALDDLTVLANRARREPDPAEQVRSRVDLLLLEVDVVNSTAQEIVHGGRELTETAKVINVVLRRIEGVALALIEVTRSLDATGARLHVGGEELTASTKVLHGDTRELIDDASRLADTTERIETDLRAVREALPRLLAALDTVEDLEGAVETVAETVEPLQGAAQRVGRVRRRLSRPS